MLYINIKKYYLNDLRKWFKCIILLAIPILMQFHSPFCDYDSLFK